MAETDIVLASKRTDQLPASAGPQPGFLMPMWNVLLQRTEKVDVSNFITSSSANIEWVSTINYGNLQVVSRGGKLWVSQQADNQGHIPGSDIAWWVEYPKGTNFSDWVADSVYTESKVIVFRTIANTRLNVAFENKGSSFMFELNPDVARPYLSTDFDAELLAGDWIPFHIPNYLHILFSVDEPLTIPLKYLHSGTYLVSPPITANRSVSLVTDGSRIALNIIIIFYANAGVELTFPDNPPVRTVRHRDAGGWISTHTWKADADVDAQYILRGVYFNDNFYIESITGPLVDPTP